MIVKMSKIYVVVKKTDRDRLLKKLHQLGLVHLVAVDASRTGAEESVITALDTCNRAMQILSSVAGEGAKPDVSVSEAIVEIMRLQKTEAEQMSSLSALHRQLSQQAIWGDVRLEDIKKLEEAGFMPGFFKVTSSAVEEIKAEFVVVLGESEGKKTLVAVVDRAGHEQLPEGAEKIALPQKDNPTIRAEAAAIDAKRKESAKRLGELASLLPEMNQYHKQLSEEAEFSKAVRGAAETEELFALQGWGPSGEADNLALKLCDDGIKAAVKVSEPAEDELPPTLVRYPRWSQPIKGLFNVLATYPGYREVDLSGFFMLALPLFAAMLIGDTGYGLLFTLLGVLMYRKLEAVAGKETVQLLIVVGLVTMAWGIMSANYFGITPESMALAGGYAQNKIADYGAMRNGNNGWATVGNAMIAVAPLWRENSADARAVLIKVSFLLGCLHLMTAHLRQAIAFWPNHKALAEIGWALVLSAMLGVIWALFFGATEKPPVPKNVIVGTMIAGLGLTIVFSVPSKNPIKRLLMGLMSSILPFVGTFGDTISYIRLMAVGLASYYIAVAFNSLGATIALGGTWFAAAPVLVFGHLLNIMLSLIAIFAHGVRLNMLEFSNNAGVQWFGYEYEPFAKNK
jgi:V/A-type H+/Na+-transporting ATPase subunit I